MDHPMNAYSHTPQQGAGAMSQAQGPAMGQGMGQAMQGQYSHSMGYAGYPMVAPQYPQQQNSGLLNERFFKGLLIGAAAAYLLTNENVQRTAIKGAVKAWSLLQGGVDELKERFHDAEAEIRAESGE